MEDQRVYREALMWALDRLGNERRLASCLRVSPQALSSWIRGDVPVPLNAFVDALEIVGEVPALDNENR